MQAPQRARLTKYVVGSRQRLRVAGRELLVENRLGRDQWDAAYRLALDAIRGVYTYSTPDWAYLWVAAGYFVVLAVVLSIAAVLSQASPAAIGMGALALALIVVGLTAYRVAAVRTTYVRVDTATHALIWRRGAADVLESLLALLTPPPPDSRFAPPAEETIP